MQFPCHIEKGILKTNADSLRNYAKGKPDGNYVIIIEPADNTRGLNQNKFYWKYVVKLIGDEIGYEPYKMHDIFKAKFNQSVEDLLDEKLTLGATTTKLTYEEFEQYIDRIRDWALEKLNIIVPQRGENIDN